MLGYIPRSRRAEPGLSSAACMCQHGWEAQVYNAAWMLKCWLGNIEAAGAGLTDPDLLYDIDIA